MEFVLESAPLPRQGHAGTGTSAQVDLTFSMAFPDKTEGSPMYKVIVVGTDGSDRAAIAVREAMSLAKVSGAELHAVNVVHASLSVGFSDSRAQQDQVNTMKEEAEKIRSQLLADAEAEGVSLKVHNPGGDPAKALLGMAENVSADLVVVGNRGMSGAKRFVKGSLPNTVAHNSHCDVLIVDTDTA